LSRIPASARAACPASVASRTTAAAVILFISSASDRRSLGFGDSPELETYAMNLTKVK